MGRQPRKNIKLVNETFSIYGNEERRKNQQFILDDNVISPKPLEYADIDRAVFDFVDQQLDFEIEGKRLPTFTLYSNQRFSEYSQMWEHSDEDGNLYLNFKTVNREKNIGAGKNQGNLWNIPGNRHYTLLKREMTDDNGVEYYEIHSMKQPFSVDMRYTVHFVTNTFENLNQFNQKLNYLFKSKQCYIKPNGYYLPMVIDTIDDETSYAVTERKFFVTKASIDVYAYIIRKEDFEVKRYPKNVNALVERKPSTSVSVEEIWDDNSNLEQTTTHAKLAMDIEFQPNKCKTEFTFDTTMRVTGIEKENVRTFTLEVNDNICNTDKPFIIGENDEVKVRIRRIAETKPSKIKLIGIESLTAEV